MSFLKHFGILFLILSFLTLTVHKYLGHPNIGIDDANIFFNYAKHFANGEGFVFNTNGEKVEGFTSLLWVLICSAFYCVSDSPELMIIIFSLLIISLTVTLVYEEVKKDILLPVTSFARKYFFWIYSLFIICIGPSYVAWSVLSLMENALWQLIFISILVLTLGIYDDSEIPRWKKIILPMLGPLLILTRPEGVAWVIFFSILLFWCEWKNKRSLLLPVSFFISCLITAVSLTYFRLHYFGYPLPNTFYAKVSGNQAYNISEGIKYAFSFVTGYNPLITFLLCALAIVALFNLLSPFIPGKKMADFEIKGYKLNRMTIVCLVVMIGITLPLTTGGDHFGGFRFYQGIMLLLAWGIPAFMWLHFESFTNRMTTAILSFSFVVLSFLLLTSANTLYNIKYITNTEFAFEFHLASDGRTLAKDLNNCWPGAKPSVGVTGVGGFGLVYRGTTVDLMGLNNTLMGHSPGERIGIKNHAAFNKDIFYQLNADLVLPRFVPDEKEAYLQYADLLRWNNFENKAMKNIFNDDYFQKHYAPVIITKINSGKHIFSFVSENMLKKMETDNSLTFNKINL